MSYTITTPIRPLKAHDSKGGHVEVKHIEKSLSYLRNRLVNEPKLHLASSFWNIKAANIAINYAVMMKFDDIIKWLATPTSNAKKTYRVNLPINCRIGYSIRKRDSKLAYCKIIRLTLARLTPHDFFILTAFPQ